jgi:hypothetical protein
MARTPFSFRTTGQEALVTQESKRHSAQHLLIHGSQDALLEERVFDKLKDVTPIEDRAFLSRCIVDMHGYLQSLLHRNDRMGMAASIESRFPFLENALIDFALHLGRRAKYDRNQGKLIVKSAAERYLPQSTVYAEKVGFAVPSAQWLAGCELLENGFVQDVFKWDRRQRQTMPAFLAAQPRLLYSILSVEIWGRLYFGHQAPDELGERLVAALPRVSCTGSSITTPTIDSMAQVDPVGILVEPCQANAESVALSET